MFPAFAELEGAGASERQRRLLLVGLRVGTALMLVLALPLLLIPDLLIKAWIGGGFHGSYAVMAILAGVLLVHQPIYVLTQFLIARARQRQVAVVSIVVTLANLALSFVLAWVWGLPGVAVSTLMTDAAMLAWLVPQVAAPAATTSSVVLLRAVWRPVLPAAIAALAVLVLLARAWEPQTLLAFVPFGAVWTGVAAVLIWRFGLAATERELFRRELWRGRVAASPVEL
jgi:O-antigen/teichoic acid export membrane protein